MGKTRVLWPWKVSSPSPQHSHALIYKQCVHVELGQGWGLWILKDVWDSFLNSYSTICYSFYEWDQTESWQVSCLSKCTLFLLFSLVHQKKKNVDCYPKQSYFVQCFIPNPKHNTKSSINPEENYWETKETLEKFPRRVNPYLIFAT